MRKSTREREGERERERHRNANISQTLTGCLGFGLGLGACPLSLAHSRRLCSNCTLVSSEKMQSWHVSAKSGWLLANARRFSWFASRTSWQYAAPRNVQPSPLRTLWMTDTLMSMVNCSLMPVCIFRRVVSSSSSIR